jgi:hypothetical protein
MVIHVGITSKNNYTNIQENIMLTINDIAGFKLISGNELIGKITAITETEYVLDDAIYWGIVQVQENPDKWDVQFVPLSPGAKTQFEATHPAITIRLPKTSLLFSPFALRAEIEARYKQLVSPIALIVPGSF